MDSKNTIPASVPIKKSSKVILGIRCVLTYLIVSWNFPVKYQVNMLDYLDYKECDLDSQTGI